MKKSFYLGAASLAAMLAAPAYAQDAEEADSRDIVVTANRTESLLSETPIAITAIGGADLIASGITNPTQLQEAVPNLSIVRGNGLQITIRGVTSTDGTEKGDPSAAFMLDGIYLARPQAQEVSFFDIERVEVLRGPQGTLYGRNSTAGVVNILSTRPKFEFGASIDVNYGSFDALNATAVINVPVNDVVALRAAVNVDRRDSYLIDGNAGDGVDYDPFKDNQSIRVSALIEPSEDVSLLIIGDYSTIEGNPTNGVAFTNFFSNVVTGGRPTFEAPTYLNPSNEDARTRLDAQAQQAFRDNEEFGIMAELNVGLGFADFTYLGSYRGSDRTEFSVLGAGAFGADFVGDYWQTSQEARLAFGEGPLQGQVGAYFFKERSGIAFFINNLLGPDTRFGFPQDPTVAENKSIFGQITYEIMPDLRLTGGMRYSRDFKSRVGNTVLDSYDYVNSSYDIGPFIERAVFQDNDAARSFSKVTWRLGVDYISDMGLIFASVSTGYKAGGFNDGCEVGNGPICASAAADLYYNPETLTAYEAGFKFDLTQDIRFNGTVFHYDYQNLQLSGVENVCGGPCQVTRNAGVAKVDGLELDAQFFPVDGLTLTAALNWLDARYVEFTPSYDSNPDPDVFTAAFVDFAGRPLSRSPKWSGGFGANYAIPAGDGEVVLDGQFTFRSSYDLTDLGNYAYFFQGGHTKTDLSITYNGADDAYYIGAFVENLENDLVLTGAGAGGFGTATFSDPRTFGVRVGAHF